MRALGPIVSRCYDAGMETREKTFLLRFTLEAQIPEALFEEEDFEEDAWLDEWEVDIKPGLIRAVFAQLRATPTWSARVRNRGVSPLDEIEIVVTRRLGGDAVVGSSRREHHARCWRHRCIGAGTPARTGL